MNLIKENFDEEKLRMLCSYVLETPIEIKLNPNDVKKFNTYVQNNDLKEINNYFLYVNNILKILKYVVVYNRVSNLWDFVFKRSYEAFDNNISREEFLSKLTDYEKIAVQFQDFERQILDGGLIQWHKNGYSNDFDNMYKFLENCDFKKKQVFMDILITIHQVIENIESLDSNDNFYNSDYKTRLSALNDCGYNYLKIRKSWRNYFEKYLIDNMPIEYSALPEDKSLDIKI